MKTNKKKTNSKGGANNSFSNPLGHKRLDIPTELRILVPMDLQAYVVHSGNRVDHRKDLSDGMGMKESKSSYEEIDKETSGLEDGIHLHWSLPDALLVGRPNPENEKEHIFPSLPDRWIIVRQWSETFPDSNFQKCWRHEAWVLDSSTKIVTPHNQWIESGPSSTRITAIDDGDPETEEDLAWLETYDGANGIFTFHDTPENLPSGSTLNYMVAGWYSDKTQDPLFAEQGTTEESWFENIDTLGWSVDAKEILTQVSRLETTTSRQEENQNGGVVG